MKAIGIDLGGTRIKVGVVKNGNLLDGTVIDSLSGEGFKARLPFIENEINHLITKNGNSNDKLDGIGISLPGIVDPKQMKLLSINEKFNDAVGFNFKQWAKHKWNLPVVAENDARASLVGEWQFGAGKGYDNLVMVTLGTGFGGAALIGGKLLYGKHFTAGCLAGHFSVNYKGTVCNCGSIGCVESEASTWKLPKIVKNYTSFAQSKLSKVEIIDYEQVFNLEKQGDTLAREIIDLSLKVWFSGVLNQVHAYDPEMVVLGGGIMRSGNKILSYISMMVEKHAWTPWGKVKVVAASDLDWAAVKGVCYLLEASNK